MLSRVAFSASEESPQGKNEGFQVRSLQEGTDKTYRDEISSAWDSRAQVMLEAPE